VFYRHPDGRTTTVPHHPGRDLARPLVREILREIDLTPERFRQELAQL
jgi:predicted RNA binding protein YcfA (HicA-like mRNA interferase family)